MLLNAANARCRHVESSPNSVVPRSCARSSDLAEWSERDLSRGRDVQARVVARCSPSASELELVVTDIVKRRDRAGPLSLLQYHLSATPDVPEHDDHHHQQLHVLEYETDYPPDRVVLLEQSIFSCA